MEQILSDRDLNLKWLNSSLCNSHDIHIMEYELISRPRKMSLKRCVTTKCYITAEVLWFCLTGKIWPDGGISFCNEHQEVKTLYVDCDQEHVFIIHNNHIYDSCWNKYQLNQRPLPYDILNKIQKHEPFDLPMADDTILKIEQYEYYTINSSPTELEISKNYNILCNATPKFNYH